MLADAWMLFLPHGSFVCWLGRSRKRGFYIKDIKGLWTFPGLQQPDSLQTAVYGEDAGGDEFVMMVVRRSRL